MPNSISTCNVSGCMRPRCGVLSIATPSGSFRVNSCNEHGRRASSGELLVFDVLGSKYALGGSVGLPVQYEPRQR